MGAVHWLYGTDEMMPCFSSWSISWLMVSLMVKGMGQGLKNRGVASGSTWSVAEKGVMRPASFEKDPGDVGSRHPMFDDE